MEHVTFSSRSMTKSWTLAYAVVLEMAHFFNRKYLSENACEGGQVMGLDSLFVSGISKFWFSGYFSTHVPNSVFYTDQNCFFIRFWENISVPWLKMDKKRKFSIDKMLSKEAIVTWPEWIFHSTIWRFDKFLAKITLNSFKMSKNFNLSNHQNEWSIFRGEYNNLRLVRKRSGRLGE